MKHCNWNARPGARRISYSIDEVYHSSIFFRYFWFDGHRKKSIEQRPPVVCFRRFFFARFNWDIFRSPPLSESLEQAMASGWSVTTICDNSHWQQKTICCCFIGNNVPLNTDQVHTVPFFFSLRVTRKFREQLTNRFDGLSIQKALHGLN